MIKPVGSDVRVQGEVRPREAKKGLPVKVKAQGLEAPREHRVVKGKDDRVIGVSRHISVKGVKPVELRKTVFNVVEVRDLREIVRLKKSLGRPHLSEFDLRPFGVNRSVQVIGNVYVPIKRSEHLELQSTLMRASHEMGIKHGVTFVIVEDELWDEAIGALELHSGTILTLPEVEGDSREEEPEGAVMSRNERVVWREVEPRVKARVIKVMTDRIAEEFYVKERSEEKRERARLKEEKFIKFAIAEYERLQKMVLVEAEKHDFEEIVHKWEDSLPPFPVRLIRNSTLWRELKTKMIESCRMR